VLQREDPQQKWILSQQSVLSPKAPLKGEEVSEEKKATASINVRDFIEQLRNNKKKTTSGRTLHQTSSVDKETLDKTINIIT
jgi:hypothetical protein